MHELTKCAGCGTPRRRMRHVLVLGDSPLADEFPADPDQSQQRWPLDLLRCPVCSMVQLGTVVPDGILWGGDYGFYTGASSVAVQQQTAYAEQVMAEWPQLCRRGVVEIACNDGTMLKAFRAAGHPTFGIDPAAGPIDAARRLGLEVTHGPFTADAARRIVADIGRAGVVVANNVIAHVADLHDFLAGLAILADDDGVIVVEFQYLADLILGNQIDHVYHEHRRFLSLTALNRALSGHNLHVTRVEQTTPQGGSLRCTIRRIGDYAPAGSVGWLLADERWLDDPHALDGLQGRADRIRHRLVHMLNDLRGQGLRVAGYGASAKATTLLNWCDIGPDLVQYIVDTTPTKHGRYMPGTRIPIVSPSADSRAPDVYLLMIWNYLPAVMRHEAQFTAAGGRWLVPIPAPVLI